MTISQRATPVRHSITVGPSLGKTFSVFADEMASWWPIDTTWTRLRKWLAGEKLLDALVRKAQNLSSVADAQVRFIY